MATTDEDLKRWVVEAYKASNKVLMVGFNRRFSILGIEAKKRYFPRTKGHFLNKS